MSELDEGSVIPKFGTENNDSVDSPGAQLRSAREAAGVHIASLAASLKIPVSKIEALENNNFSALPDAVFARALASSICRALGLDATSVLKSMPKNDISIFSTATPRINTTFKDSSQKNRRNSFLTQITRPVGVAVMVLLLGALAVGFLPFGNHPLISADVSADAALQMSESEDANALIVPAPITESLTVSKSVADVKTVPIIVDTASAGSTEGLPSAVADVASSSIEFRARGESWVQVRNAKKAVIFERTLAKDEIVSTTGTLPFTVVIGRADVTDVFVRGQAFELAGVSKENVARFEVTQ